MTTQPPAANLDQAQMLADMKAMAAEPLHPDLADWVEEGPFGPALKHPLVYQVVGLVPGMANRQYAYKSTEVATARAEGDWHRFIWLHERPYRLRALTEALMGMPTDHAAARDLVTQVWTDSENIWENAPIWSHLLRAIGLSMTPDEQKALDTLPADGGYITVYRGGAITATGDRLNMGDGAFSWTTDRAKAEWFATRSLFADRDDDPDDPAIRVGATGRVHRNDVIALLLGRGEDEVVAIPANVKDITETEVAHR